MNNQSNKKANPTKKTVIQKVGSVPFEYATELVKASTQSDFLSVWKYEKKIRNYFLYLV